MITLVYKIFILIRYDEKKPLWAPLMIPKKLADSDVVVYEEFSTDNVEELKLKILELLDTISISKIKIVNEIEYSVIVSLDSENID